MLTPWERVIRELEHEEPDRVPWGGEGISQPTADVVLGRPALTGMGGRPRILELQAQGRHTESRSRMAADIFDLAKRLKIDLVQVVPLPPGSGDRPTITSPNEWTYDGKTKLRTVSGNLLTIEIDSETGQRVKHDMPDLEGFVERLDIGRSELEASVDETVQGIGPLVKSVKRDLQAAVFFPAWNCFLTHPDWLLTFLTAFHVRPDLITKFEKAQCMRALAYGKGAIDCGADVVGIGGDLAYKKGPMISPDNYRRFIMPYMRKESRSFHKRGAYTMIASDGNLMPIAQDYFLSSEVDAAREIEPGPMDRATVKREYGDRVCLNGNVDCGATLGLRSPSEVIRETRQCIVAWAPGGGHILSSSNTISPNVRPENFLAMWRALLKYGRYH